MYNLFQIVITHLYRVVLNTCHPPMYMAVMLYYPSINLIYIFI